MSIRKSKRKIALCIAALFWAACDNDSSSAPDVTIPPESSDIPGSSVTPTSSETAPAESSSSDAITPESSSAYVNPDYPYTLDNDPSVHCKDSTYHHISFCPSSKPRSQVIAELQENTPLYGNIQQPVCADQNHDYAIFKCDDGSMYPGSPYFLPQKGLLIQQDYTDDGKWIPTKEKIAKDIEEAEASTDFPYKLAKDSTINCKITYRTRTNTAGTQDFTYQKLQEDFFFKCEDGNSYEKEEMLRDEEGYLYKRKDT